MIETHSRNSPSIKQYSFIYRFIMTNGRKFEYEVDPFIVPLNRILQKNQVKIYVSPEWRGIYQSLLEGAELDQDLVEGP